MFSTISIFFLCSPEKNQFDVLPITKFFSKSKKNWLFLSLLFKSLWPLYQLVARFCFMKVWIIMCSSHHQYSWSSAMFWTILLILCEDHDMQSYLIGVSSWQSSNKRSTSNLHISGKAFWQLDCQFLIARFSANYFNCCLQNVTIHFKFKNSHNLPRLLFGPW